MSHSFVLHLCKHGGVSSSEKELQRLFKEL
jgi:hypothetical protein